MHYIVVCVFETDFEVFEMCEIFDFREDVWMGGGFHVDGVIVGADYAFFEFLE